MNRTTRRVRLSACAGIMSIGGLVSPALADDSPLVFTPSKIDRNAYKVRMGVKLPTTLDTSVGADVSVLASEDGRIRPKGMPVKIWGALGARSGQGSGSVRNREISAQFNTVTGQSNVAVSNSRTWIVTPGLDFESHRALQLSCNSYEKHCSSFSASQSARASLAQTGTAFVAQATVSGMHADIGGRIGIEQTVSEHLNLGLALDNPMSAPVGSVTARYALNW